MLQKTFATKNGVVARERLSRAKEGVSQPRSKGSKLKRQMTERNSKAFSLDGTVYSLVRNVYTT